MTGRGSTIVSEDEMTRQETFINSVREQFPKADKKYMISTFGCQMNENDSEKRQECWSTWVTGARTDLRI